jgi:hypothetical protein
MSAGLRFERLVILALAPRVNYYISDKLRLLTKIPSNGTVAESLEEVFTTLDVHNIQHQFHRSGVTVAIILVGDAS